MPNMPGDAARRPRGRSFPPRAGEHTDAERQLASLVLDLVSRHGVGRGPATSLVLSAAPPAWAGQNCSILIADVTAFGGHGRDDHDRQTVRRRMYEIIRDGFDGAGVSWVACHHEDRGDGTLVVIPPSVPTVSLVDPLLAHLAAALRRHNRQASDAVRIQLRVALNVGPVVTDTEGVTGESIIHTARLLDSPVLKEQIAATGADLGFIVSTFVYDTVVKHGPGYVDAAGFQQVRVRVKESDLTGWMHLAGSAGAMPVGPSHGYAARPLAADHPYPSLTINIAGDLILGSEIEFRR